MMLKIVCAALFFVATANCFAAEPPSETIPPAGEPTNSMPLLQSNAADSPWDDPTRFSYQVGVAYITGSTIDDIILADGHLARGPAAGQIYLFQISYHVTELHPRLFGKRYPVDLSLPLVLGVVDEHGSDAFMQYSGGVTLRWKTFPWNRWVYTQIETGVGFTYSQQVLTTERERHPDRDRSHLEIYWPVQLLLAHPQYREHQFVLFLHHHSGGGIFHEGGANSLGIGYRFNPGER